MTGRNMGWQAAVMAAAMAVGVRTAAQEPGQSSDPEVTFSADVTVTQTIVDRTGKTTRQLPGSRYRLERRAGGQMRLTMLATRASPVRGPLADVYAGITVDTDPSTGALQVRDAQGRRLETPAVGSVPAAPAGADDGLVFTADRAQRSAALVERFGQPVGSVRALHRYLARSGRMVEEVLVTPDTALPAELNRLEDGVLVEHHTFEYAPVGDGRLVRARTRSDTALPQGHGARLVAVTSLSGIRVAGGAR